MISKEVNNAEHDNNKQRYHDWQGGPITNGNIMTHEI